MSTQSDDRFTFNTVEGKKLKAGMLHRLDKVSFAAESLYQELQGKRLPTLTEIAKRAGYTEKTTAGVLTTHEFVHRMAKRGIVWSAKDRITAQLMPEQVALIAVLTDPTLKMDLKARLARAGVTYSVYRNWLKNPAFAKVIRGTAELALDDHLPDFHTKVIERGLSGDLNAIKFAYELTGRHDPAKQQMVDFNRLVMLLLEVISKYITDPVVLRSINSDVDSIMRGETPKALDVIPANYVASTVVEKPQVPDYIQELLDMDKEVPEVPEDFFEFKEED